MEVRPARLEDFAALPAIEVAAGILFRDVGMPEIAEDPPPSVEELQAAAAVLVAIHGGGEDEDDDVPVGYAWVEVIDGHAHLEQLSVLPHHGGRGVGTALLDAVAAWAADRGDREVTLTTFRDVPFNAPLYRRRGYVDVPREEWGPELVALVAAEAEHGLDPALRVVLARPLGS